MLANRRALLVDRLLEWALADPRVTGAAQTGSAATGDEDNWSDIDLFFGVTDAAPVAVLEDVTIFLYADHDAVHHFDITAGAAVYRAFLLTGLLEIDIGLAPADEFRSHGGAPFRVIFGEPGPPSPATGPDVDYLAGLIWHHVLHARTSIERNRLWQAEYWMSVARNHILTLAADRHGLPTMYAKGADALPGAVTVPLEQTLVRTLQRPELERALRHLGAAAIDELTHHDRDLAHRLQTSLSDAADVTTSPNDGGSG